MAAPDAVAFILKGYPRLSETFIAQEILALERLGLDIRIWSMRPPREAQRHPVIAEIAAPVHYLPERLRDDAPRVIRALRRGLSRAGFWKALRLWLSDMAKRPSRDLVRRFGQAMVLASEAEPDVTRLHAHFLHTPASVARYAGALTGLPWSCSAHAKDIWTIGDDEKRGKLAGMEWLTTCTAIGHAHLKGLADDARKVELSYHGIDLTRFPAPPVERPERDGSSPGDPVQLLSVGRAVEKKGFDLLIEALAALGEGIHWRWTHIGDGDALPALKARAKSLGIEKHIVWLGARSQAEVISQYRAADLFVLPCRIAADGDRDGLPNVLMEAQSQELACLSSGISAIPELIRDGETGILAPPDDMAALAEAMRGLIRNPVLRARLGRAGYERVIKHFSHEAGLAPLARRFGLPAPRSHAHPAA